MPTVLVATWGNGLFALTDGVFHQELAGQSVKGFARDHRGEALAIIGGKSLRRRTADGAWHIIAQGDRELSCCVAAGAHLYVGANDAAEVLRVGDGGFERLEGFDHVRGRDQWYAGAALINGRLLGPPLGIRSMSATCDGKAIFANVHVGGIPRSLDGGATWQPSIEIDCDVHQVCAHPTRAEIVIAAAGAGVAISRDGGATWIIERSGLHAQYCSAAAFCGDDLLVAASADHFAPQGRIYRRPTDGTGPLLAVGGGFPQWTAGITDTGNIAARGSMLAVADHGGNLYLSRDAGHSWSKQGAGLPVPSSVFVY
jgi:hypothetical protein